jgi:hypothetical protein
VITEELSADIILNVVDWWCTWCTWASVLGSSRQCLWRVAVRARWRGSWGQRQRRVVENGLVPCRLFTNVSRLYEPGGLLVHLSCDSSDHGGRVEDSERNGQDATVQLPVLSTSVTCVSQMILFPFEVGMSTQNTIYRCIAMEQCNMYDRGLATYILYLHKRDEGSWW